MARRKSNALDGATPELPALPIDACQPSHWNPNTEDLATFNELVEEIKKNGFNENIVVVRNEDGITFTIIAGEHRWKAAKLAGLTEIPAVIKEGWDEDRQKIQTVRMNVLRGRLDGPKFAALWNSMERKYGRTALMKLMGMAHREKEVERLLGQVKRSMPKEMADELEKRASKIRNVEDLAAVIQSLYAQFGATLQQSWVVFTFGGRPHLMVQLTKENLQKLKGTLAAMGERGENANELIARALTLAAQESGPA